MPGIIIVAHTPLASAMLGFAEQTFGSLPEKIQAVDIPPYEDAKVSFDRVIAAAKAVDMGNGILVLTDVMGATPANVASRLIGQIQLAFKASLCHWTPSDIGLQIQTKIKTHSKKVRSHAANHHQRL